MRILFKSAAMLVCMLWGIPYGNIAAKIKSTAGGAVLSPQDKQSEIRLLKELCDSLVIDDNFEGIIAVAQVYLTDANYSDIIVPYIVPAYYFTGDTVQSKRLLMKTIKDKTYLQIATDYLASSNLALIKYFNIEKNREPVILKALDNYKKVVKCTRSEEGQEILRFFINDQRIRKLKRAYSKNDSLIQQRIHQYQVKEDSIQNANIYNFYKQHGKYFSQKEVGSEVSSMQLIYFSHITGVTLRQTFYQPLLEKAEKEGTIDRTNLINFIIRTESIADPKFWETIKQRMPEIRKKYNMPESYMFTPF